MIESKLVSGLQEIELIIRHNKTMHSLSFQTGHTRHMDPNLTKAHEKQAWTSEDADEADKDNNIKIIGEGMEVFLGT